MGGSGLQPCAHPSGHLPARIRGFGCLPVPAWPVQHGTHVVCEVGQQVLRHIITVEQSQDDLLQVLLIDEAILIKICKEEAWPERKDPQAPTSLWDALQKPAVTGELRTWHSARPGRPEERGATT